MSSDPKPTIVRLLTLGDSGAGKSSLLLRYTQGEFNEDYMPTIGIDFRLKTMNVNGKEIKVQIWDTAGQERFRTITYNYYKGAHGIALVYDVTNEGSFQNIRKWVQDVRSHADESVNLVLLGNKCDLSQKRVVDEKRGKDLADEIKIGFFETSAKTGDGVQDAFLSLVTSVCDRLDSTAATSSSASTARLVDVSAAAGPPKKKKCC